MLNIHDKTLLFCINYIKAYYIIPYYGSDLAKYIRTCLKALFNSNYSKENIGKKKKKKKSYILKTTEMVKIQNTNTKYSTLSTVFKSQ